MFFFVIKILVQMRFPDGYYWLDPGFPSFVVPYGRSSDFFFSGLVSTFLLSNGYNIKIINNQIRRKKN